MTHEELKNIFRKYNLKVSWGFEIYYGKPDIVIGTFRNLRGHDEYGIRFFGTSFSMLISNPIAVENKLNKMIPYYKRKLVDLKIRQISKDFE